MTQIQIVIFVQSNNEKQIQIPHDFALFRNFDYELTVTAQQTAYPGDAVHDTKTCSIHRSQQKVYYDNSIEANGT